VGQKEQEQEEKKPAAAYPAASAAAAAGGGTGPASFQSNAQGGVGGAPSPVPSSTGQQRPIRNCTQITEERTGKLALNLSLPTLPFCLPLLVIVVVVTAFAEAMREKRPIHCSDLQELRSLIREQLTESWVVVFGGPEAERQVNAVVDQLKKQWDGLSDTTTLTWKSCPEGDNRTGSLSKYLAEVLVLVEDMKKSPAKFATVDQSTLDLNVFQPLDNASDGKLPAYFPDPVVIAGAPGCELMRDTGTWNHRGDSGLSLLVAVEEAGFKTAGTDLHCDNTGMTLELLEYCRRNNITEPPPERMESTDAGAVELQIGLTDNLVGHCSEIVAFSLPVTWWLKSRRGLDWTRNPAVQISKNSPLVGHNTIAAVVDAVTRAYAADHNNAVLTKGKHYRLFVVPAAGCHGYAIGRGHAHAFVRGEDYTAGVIARVWQESHGFFDDADDVAVVAAAASAAAAATTSVPSAGAGEAATTHLQEVGGGGSPPAAPSAAAATATTGGSGGLEEKQMQQQQQQQPSAPGAPLDLNPAAAAAAAAAAEGGGRRSSSNNSSLI
jgi:hypothetical protein